MRSRPYVVALLLALTACSGKVNDPAAQPTTPAAPSTPPTFQECPVVQPGDDGWPGDVPEVVPRPAGFDVEKSQRIQNGNIDQITGAAPLSHADSARWMNRELPKAGFVVDRGDYEKDREIDVVFRRGAVSGLVKVFPYPGVDPKECKTFWVYYVVRDTSAPYDISYTPPPSASPLPFG